MPATNTQRNKERRLAAQASFLQRQKQKRLQRTPARTLRRSGTLPRALTDRHAAENVRTVISVWINKILHDYEEPKDLHVNYREFERDVLTPKLEAKGFEVVRWLDGERDSFGPLSRYCIAYAPSGIRCDIVYG
jgi:hypothetical protein